MILDSSVFVGPLTIAQIGQPSVSNNVDLAIQLYEPEFLGAVLSYELYDFMGPAVIAADQNYLDLQNGCRFISTTNFPGFLPMWQYRNWYMNSKREVQWVGFKNDKFISPLASYVWFRYQKDLLSQTTGSGIVKNKTENSDPGGNQKMTMIWNNMAKALSNLWILLAARGINTYPLYDITKIDYYRFRPINNFNL